MGESSASICYWLQMERDDPSFVRNSACDCENVDGLLSNYKTDLSVQKKRAELDVPLFQLLGKLGAPEKSIHSRPQRQAIKEEGVEVWVQPSGALVCTHGNTRRFISKMRKGASSFKRKSTVACNCSLSFPRRVGSIFASTHSKRDKGYDTAQTEADGSGGEVSEGTVSEEVEDENAIGEDAVVENAVADIMSNE